MLFKTSDVIKFLHNFDCSLTAEVINKKTNGAEFVDSQLVYKELIEEIFIALSQTINHYTYAK